MINTKNDMPEATRAKVVEYLNQRLADGLDLQLQTKQAHWNVKGPHFIGLHLLFDTVFETAIEANDLIAERLVQIGGVAEGTAQVVQSRTSMPPYPLTIIDGLDHVDALSTALAAYGKCVREGIDKTSEWGDADTADLLTEVSRLIDEKLWKVEAHLRGKN